jgi:alpha-L-rhamnosidase
MIAKGNAGELVGGLAVLLFCTISVEAGMVPTDLRCEYARNPLGIDVQKSRLSWKLVSDQRAQVQTAYQVLAAGSEEMLASDKGDLWDSGKVSSNQSIHVEYDGKPLRSGIRVFWKVRVWDRDGVASAWSEPAWWEMALLEGRDWRGAWISRDRQEPAEEEKLYEEDPVPLFRKEFTIGKPIKRARVYVSGLGYYELAINGQRVGDHVLDPAWTPYARRVLYSAYDVTELLQTGRNAVAAMVGDGWYNPLPLRLWGHINLRESLTIGRPRLILQLKVEYADGTSDSIVTDQSWKVGDGPILKNSTYLGELYDARREQPGWNRPGFDDSRWPAAVRAHGEVGRLCAQAAPPIRVTRTLKPVAITEPTPGAFIFDMGQNFAGWVTLRARGPAGTAIKLRYGELLHPDGSLNVMTSVCGQIKQAGLGGPGAPPVAYQSDTYILKGDRVEAYTPRFTFHGFRYVELTGYPGRPTLEAIEGRRLNSDVADAGSFSCSNELFNRIQEMVRWTQLSNMFGVQSDCPHRERFGYGGDIVASGEAAMLNFDMARFYAKVVGDHADDVRANGGITETAPFVGISDEGLGEKSGPVGWGTVLPWLQWRLYQYYGDRRIIEENYETTRRWVQLLRSKAVDGILDNGISDHESLVPKPRALTGTAFYYYNVYLFSQIAAALGKTADAEEYAALSRTIRDAFNKHFLKPGTGQYDSGTQACQAFALFLDLVPPPERPAAIDLLVNDIMQAHAGHLTTGIFGTRFMLLALGDCGRADVACTVVNQKTFPGWGHMLERGATTLWEHWEFSDNTYSHNHPMFGSVSEWFYKVLLGIQPDPQAVGFDQIIIRPQAVGGLKWARGGYDSVRGRIAVDWRIESAMLNLDVTIPPNTIATVCVPVEGSSAVTESGKPAGQAEGVRFLRSDQKVAVYQVSSGSYRFATPRKGQ